jgi:hypothetical protein
MDELQGLFSELDKEARRVATLKDLLAGLYQRPNMEDADKLRLARTFIMETRESLQEMEYIISVYKANKVGLGLMK